MIELPDKFKQALGNGVRTSLYPIVKIYKDYNIEDTIPDDAVSINLSIKETNISGSAYKPLLLSSPSIKSSADIINNKYTISSVSLSISNAPYQGKIFSDDIQSYLNSVCRVYYTANGLNDINDCLLVYTGTIRRFSQSAETIKLELEDVTQQKLKTKIPASLIDDKTYYHEKDIGKPYPMVYGHVDKSPVIKKATPHPTTGEVFEEISNFVIDKPNRNISGAWNLPLETLYNSPNINQTTLVNDNILTNENYLFAYDNGFVPINRIMPSEWSFNYGGATPHETTTLAGVVLYNFENNLETGSNITISSEAKNIMDDIAEFTDTGLPARIYRPIEKAGFFVKNKNTFESTIQTLDDENKFYAFNNLDTSEWDPRDELVTHASLFLNYSYDINNDSPAKAAYENNIHNGWWEPTKSNEAVPSFSNHILQWEYTDFTLETLNSETAGFPIHYIQNGDDTNNGLHLTAQNYWHRSSASTTDSGSFVKLSYYDLGSFDCVTKIYYTVTYYAPRNMGYMHFDDDTGQGAGDQTNVSLVPTVFNFAPTLENIDLSTNTNRLHYTMDDILDNDVKGTVPSTNDVAGTISTKTYENDDGISEEGYSDSASVKVKGSQLAQHNIVVKIISLTCTLVLLIYTNFILYKIY